MSEFSNPAATGVADAAAYTASLLKLLSDRDPLEVMRETPQKLSAVLKDVARDRLGVPEAPGKWSIREVVQHLADSELNGPRRLLERAMGENPIPLGKEGTRLTLRVNGPGSELVPVAEKVDFADNDEPFRFIPAQVRKDFTLTDRMQRVRFTSH